ncbi:MAG: flagellar hook protein [Butyrivibrio sp.]|nr:flagellar hook protein [Butyrivibrio sp.]
MIVQHNITAMNANRMLGITTSAQAKSTEKLSSGYKINRAADDAAGLAISEKMRRQARGLTQAAANAQDGISAVQTAEGALTEVHDMLQRMNELAIKAGNGTMSESDRQSVQDEIDQLITEIDRVSETTKFNETYLLKGEGKSGSGSVKSEVSVQGGDTSAGQLVKATGNIYEGKIKADDLATPTLTNLAAGTEDVAKITYKDADGKQRTREVSFIVGSDEKATAANLAEAIGSDDELKKIFKASAEDGKLTVESKLNGNKTDDTKNAVTNIEFNVINDGTFKTQFDGTPVPKAAKREGYALKIGSGDAVDATIKKFTDRSSITVDGKTYTFDANNTAGDKNSFKSLQELQDLLGSDYEVSMTVSALASKAGGDDVALSQTVDAATAGAKAINALTQANEFTTIAAPTGFALKAGSVEATINVVKKADVSAASDVLNFSLQVGADTTEENKINVDIESMSAKSLGIDNVSVTGKDSSNADEAVNTVADAIAKVSKQRSALGAIQNRLEHTINNLNNVVENTTSAEAAIRDTDIATEMVKYANNNILQQAGTSMLAQANQSNQLALSLLG